MACMACMACKARLARPLLDNLLLARLAGRWRNRRLRALRTLRVSAFIAGGFKLRCLKSGFLRSKEAREACAPVSVPALHHYICRQGRE